MSDELQKLENENTELSNELYKSVEFYNGDTWLETVVVMRGDDAVYTGDTPISTDNPDMTFSGWEPEPSNVKENLKCYAQYDSNVAFAFYSTSDNSLNFYYGDVPEEGTTYDSKTVTSIYTGFEAVTYTSYAPWYENGTVITTINFNESFIKIQSVSTAYWFYGFTNCTEINGLEYLNTSSVTNMGYMFRDCHSLTTLDVSGFDTSSVTNMGYMFRNCSSLTTLDLSKFNTSSVTDMQYMFYSCGNLTALDLSKFDTSSVKIMFYMFHGCSNLTTLDLSGFNTSSITNMANMFYLCSSLTTLDVSGFDTSSVTNMTNMFCNCENLVTIYSNDALFTTAKVTSDSSMFGTCKKLVGGNGTIFDSSKINSSMAHIDTADNPGYFTAK